MDKQPIDYDITNLKWKITNKDYKLNRFDFGAFKFKFKIENNEHKHEFVDFLEENKNLLLPWDFCNFFIERNIKYSINYRYLKEVNLKDNLYLLYLVIYLKKEKFLKNIKKPFAMTIERKEINGRKRISFLFQYFNHVKKSMYFIQTDSNIWWKPRKIEEKNENAEVTSFGWLFMQIGKYKNLKID